MLPGLTLDPEVAPSLKPRSLASENLDPDQSRRNTPGLDPDLEDDVLDQILDLAGVDLDPGPVDVDLRLRRDLDLLPAEEALIAEIPAMLRSGTGRRVLPDQFRLAAIVAVIAPTDPRAPRDPPVASGSGRVMGGGTEEGGGSDALRGRGESKVTKETGGRKLRRVWMLCSCLTEV